jgi:hypothetical protein
LAGQNFLTYQYASGTVPPPSWATSSTTALAPMAEGTQATPETPTPALMPAEAATPSPLLPEESLQ